MAVNSNAQYAYRYLQDKYGLTPEQAAGVVGNLMQESSLNTGAINPGDGNDGTDSIGIAQWNGKRARNLRNFASERDGGVNSLDNQLDFVMHELKTDERPAFERLMNAQDVKSATAAMIGYERPQGWSAKNPYNGHGWNNRFKYAATLHGMSPEEIAQAQITPGKTLADQPAQNTTANPTTETAQTNPAATEPKTPFGLKLPETIAGIDTKQGLGLLGGIAQMMNAEPATPPPARGGLLGGGQQTQFIPNINAAKPVDAPAGGLLGGAGTLPMNAKMETPSLDEVEKRKKLLALLGGDLGGLGGLGSFV